MERYRKVVLKKDSLCRISPVTVHLNIGNVTFGSVDIADLFCDSRDVAFRQFNFRLCDIDVGE